MEENFATRLKLFMESAEIPSSQFADLCEIPRPSFSQLLSGRNQKISDTLIRKIHAAFPHLSIMWLMFGEGTMLSNDKEMNSKSAESIEQKNLSDISKSSTGESSSRNYSNVETLTKPENSLNSAIYQQFEDNKKILELQMQIEKLQKNPRRVAQITVYYDDSTFETFVPSK